ncbi:hypothetical protein, partial [Klebsiella sp. CN_Kp084]|uniref:hypothetical protein n=1 Tax=Klebsiella sp. CN_Kp084 TaxID=3153414 RepID=UPI0032B3A8AA
YFVGWRYAYPTYGPVFVGSPGKRKRNRGAFNGGAIILSDGATLIRPTVRYSLVAPVSASATGERSMAAPLFCRMALRLSDLRSGIRW